jgi:hypothetical protein
MKILLNNGIELNPIIVVGGGRYLNGVKRDTLNFIFPESVSLDELDGIFTAENCKTIKIYEDNGNEYIHTGYTLRSGISRRPVVVVEPTEDTEAVIENRVTVSMALVVENS